MTTWAFCVCLGCTLHKAFDLHCTEYTICLLAAPYIIICIFLLYIPVFQTGLELPGSKTDVVRTKSLSGPSPVGGSMGGYESLSVYPLDEFELQAAHYNLACANANVGNLDEVRALCTLCVF